MGIGRAGVRRSSVGEEKPSTIAANRLSIGVAMLLIAGAALGFWLARICSRRRDTKRA